DEHVAVGRRLHGVGGIGDCPSEQPALAVVAYARPARPPRRHAACLGELEQAFIARMPAAACVGPAIGMPVVESQGCPCYRPPAYSNRERPRWPRRCWKVFASSIWLGSR